MRFLVCICVVVFVFGPQRAFAAWQDNFSDDYDAFGLTFAVESALASAVSSADILGYVMTEPTYDIKQTAKALFCAGEEPQTVIDAAARLGIAAADMTSGLEEAVLECDEKIALSARDLLDLLGDDISVLDITPSPFNVADQNNVSPSSVVTSSSITVNGISVFAPISIVGGSYAINNGSYTAAAGAVYVGDTVTVRHTASSDFSAQTMTELTIGGVSDTFFSTTVAGFDFASKTAGSGSGSTAGSSSDARYAAGTVITLSASADSGSSFTGWTPASCVNGFSLVADTTCTATFTLNEYAVSPSAAAGGAISPNTVQTISHGDTAQFTVIADAGYHASVGGTCGGSLAGNTYTTNPVTADCSVSAQFFPVFTVNDEQNAPLGDSTLQSGGALRFTLDGGSGSFDVVVASNANGVSGVLEDNGDGSYRFEPPASGAFAGDYLITITDTVSGRVKQLTVSVPLQVMLSRTTLLALGERNNAQVTVTGAAPATAITLDVDSGSAGMLPTADDTDMLAADDNENGNPAIGRLLAQATEEPIDFVVVATATGYPDGQASARVLPASRYAGSLQNAVGSAVQGNAALRVTVDGNTTTLQDELGVSYETNTDTMGQFTIIGPADGIDYHLRFSASGYAAMLVEASTCEAIAPCQAVLDYELDSATPELNPPGGTFSNTVTVTLTTTTADATLSYTVDGSTPGRDNGTHVASGSQVQLASDTTLKVIAWKDTLNDSEVVSADYTIKKTIPGSTSGRISWSFMLALAGMVLLRRRPKP